MITIRRKKMPSEDLDPSASDDSLLDDSSSTPHTVPVMVSRDQLEASICRESYRDFVKRLWDVVVTEMLVWNWHMNAVCEHLQEMAERVFRGEPKKWDSVINIPPGMSKSALCSVFFPAWVWTRMPSAKFICASYSYPLAMDLSRKCRDVVTSEKYTRLFGDIGIREDQDAKAYFVNEKGGLRYSSGTGGSITGFHGHFLIVDDPIDPNQAASDADLAAANRWMQETLPSRMVDKKISVTILVMQRLHQNDPAANMLEQARSEGSESGFDIRHINLPAEVDGSGLDEVRPRKLVKYYTPDPDQPGSRILDTVRLPRIALKHMRARLLDHGYAAQFLLRPTPRTGGMFNVERFILEPIPPRPTQLIQVVRFWDKACLVAGTLISTRRGEVPIESVCDGDEVVTRQGWKRVRRVWKTKEVENVVSVGFDNGKTVSGTHDHLVWTLNRGWVELSALRWRDRCLALHSIQRCGSSEECSTVVAQANGTSRQWSRSRGIGKPNLSIERSGSSTMGISPVDITYTTKMETGTITRLRILRASSLPTTSETMGCSRGIVEHLNGRKIIGKPSRHLLEFLGLDLFASSLAYYAGHYSCRSIGILRDCGTARKSARGVERLIEKRALFVGCTFGVLGPCVPIDVLERFGGEIVSPVEIDSRGGEEVSDSAQNRANERISVYDIEVEDAHEFFANGILVHNSTEKGGAYTAGVKIAKDHQGYFWILDVVRGQWDSAKREQTIKQIAQLDGLLTLVEVEQEPGSGGKESAENTIRNLAGFRVRAFRPTGDKQTRADPFSVQVNAGNVRIVRGEWNRAYIEELRYFPHSRFKDQVDASSGAFGSLTRSRMKIGGGFHTSSVMRRRT